MEIINPPQLQTRKRRYKKVVRDPTGKLRSAKKLFKPNKARQVMTINRTRRQLGFSNYDVSLLQYGIYDTQYNLMSTPSFSLIIPLTVIATGVAINQRGNDLTPYLKNTAVKLHITQADNVDITYRIIGITLLDSYDLTTPLLPLQVFDQAPTTTNFAEVSYLLGPNRTIQYKIWYDHEINQVTAPTGTNPKHFNHFFKVPSCSVKYSQAEHGTTGLLAKGHQLVLILTDAVAGNGSYLIDYSFKRRFSADGK